MSIVLRRTYLTAKNNVLSSGNIIGPPGSSNLFCRFTRSFNEDKTDHPGYINSTILVENNLNVQELPVVVRKLKDITEIAEKSHPPEDVSGSQDSLKYHLIQAEFKQCVDLRDVFSLLSKCTRITPNIALGAMERIYDIEKNPNALTLEANTHVGAAKGAILDKLLRVVMKTEDTQTILNILNTVSSFMDPYKPKFCNELLFRVLDDRLTIDQLCEFVTFLNSNKSDQTYTEYLIQQTFSEMIDKLWIGFLQKENSIDESNIGNVFKVLPALKASKKTILTMLEQKLCDVWTKINISVMQDILTVFVNEKYSSLQSFAVVGRWVYTNIHALDDDALLDVVSKLTRLNYTDNLVEKGVEKYIRLKGLKIDNHILLVGILNYCMQFQICNEAIFSACSEYFLVKGKYIPPSFLKSFIYPFGHLSYDRKPNFWQHAEAMLLENLDKMTADDLSSIILSFIYVGQYPLELVSKVFTAEYLAKISNPRVLKKLQLIDTSLSLECSQYSGPMMPKDQWTKPIVQDSRVRNIIEKIKDSFVAVAGGAEKLSYAVLIPYIHSHETYMIDIMLHPTGLGSNTFNWKLKTGKNENTAILIHLPDHFCSGSEQLIGPQLMRKKHLRLLGMKVVSLKYSVISQFYTSFNTNGLRKYLSDSIDQAETCL